MLSEPLSVLLAHLSAEGTSPKFCRDRYELGWGFQAAAHFIHMEGDLGLN